MKVTKKELTTLVILLVLSNPITVFARSKKTDSIESINIELEIQKNSKSVGESFAFQEGYSEVIVTAPPEEKDEPIKDIQEDEVPDEFGIKYKRGPASQ